jgi:hypothetical protein
MTELETVLVIWAVDLCDERTANQVYAVHRHFHRKRKGFSLRRTCVPSRNKLYFYTIGEEAEIFLAEWLLESRPKMTSLRYHLNPLFHS